MTLTSRFRSPVRFGLKVLGALAFLAPLATRLVLGQAFFLTGRGKLENFPRTVEFFASLGIPMPELNAAFVSRLVYLLFLGWLVLAGPGAASLDRLLFRRFTTDEEPTKEVVPPAGVATA